MHEDSFRSALRSSDSVLGKYEPLEKILCVDDFDTGQHGWAPYFPDYDGWDDYDGRYEHVEPLNTIAERTHRGTIDNRTDRKFPIGPRAIPQISNLPMWDVGTYGSWNSYALKIPTLPRAGHQGVALKRLANPWHRKLRVETYFTHAAEPSDYRLGESDIHSLFVTFDVHDPYRVAETGKQPRRWWPALRYLNHEDGRLVQKWQAMYSGSKGSFDGPWDDIANGRQQLGFNRAPTKFQWHYLRFTFDLSTYEYVDFNCYGKEFDVGGRTHVFDPPLVGWRASTDKAHGLIGAGFGIETNSDKRCFLYLDSVVVSASEE